MKQKKVSGAEAFDSYFSALFGERWSELKTALIREPRYHCLSEILSEPYWLDAGSYDAAQTLAAIPETNAEDPRWLDLCAAPGGKTLILALSLPENAFLTSNELSSDRRSRLLRVLDSSLPQDIRSRVSVTGHDGARWSRYEQSCYDRILLDVPCSSERHVLSSPKHLQTWSPARIKNLAVRQWSLLSGAFLVLKTGGYLLYSTCALSPEENDNIIDKLIKKYSDAQVCTLPLESAGDILCSAAEKTRWGLHVLPDRCDGAGPLYYCLVKRFCS